MYFWGVENFDARYYFGCKISGYYIFLGLQYEALSDPPPIMYNANTPPPPLGLVLIICINIVTEQLKFGNHQCSLVEEWNRRTLWKLRKKLKLLLKRIFL